MMLIRRRRLQLGKPRPLINSPFYGMREDILNFPLLSRSIRDTFGTGAEVKNLLSPCSILSDGAKSSSAHRALLDSLSIALLLAAPSRRRGS
jgi:hypothetical protein